MKADKSGTWSVFSSSVREVVLIVTGILIAFILDAWWDDRVEQREIREALEAAQLDFMATKTELDSVLAANRDYIRNVAHLMSLAPADVARLDATASGQLARLLPTGGLTFDPVLGSVDALISSGQLHRLDNVPLRSAIASWPSLLDEIGEDHQILIDMYMAQQERSVELGLYFIMHENEPFEPAGSWQARYLDRVVQDPEMLNRLGAHQFAVEELNHELGAVSTHLDRILALLRSELGEAQAALD